MTSKELCGISWYFVVFYGILWYFMVFAKEGEK